MIVALRNEEAVALQVLVHHVPGFALTTDAQAMPLADGVVHEALMGSHQSAIE